MFTKVRYFFKTKCQVTNSQTYKKRNMPTLHFSKMSLYKCRTGIIGYTKMFYTKHFPLGWYGKANDTFINIMHAIPTFRHSTFIKSLYINILTPLNCIHTNNSGKKYRYLKASKLIKARVLLTSSTSLPSHHLPLSSTLPLFPAELQVSLVGKNIWVGYHPPAR